MQWNGFTDYRYRHEEKIAMKVADFKLRRKNANEEKHSRSMWKG